MWVRELRLDNFRNYERLELHLGKGVNVFVGQNGAGKTNLLEGVYLLATGRALRASREAEMLRWGSDWTYLRALVEARSGDLVVEVSLGKAGKSSRVNGCESRRIHDLLGNLKVVFFSPDELNLVKGPPQARRRYMDILLSQVSKAYYQFALLYYRLVNQKNAYLKEVGQGKPDRDLLESLDEALSAAGARLVIFRGKALEELGRLALGYMQRITGGREELAVVYSPSAPGLQRTGYGEESFELVRDELKKEIARARNVELARRISLIGPHRDDICFILNGKDVRCFGSQGQQRSAVLALKLAEVDFIREATGDSPVLLLDDVFSELDNARKTFLGEVLSGTAQCLLTTAELGSGDHLQEGYKDCYVFEIADGRVVSCNH
ncbi:MAG: DNA replication/repair protein RecF [Bacillota bacterium]